MITEEETRLQEAREQKIPWKKWGPYLSERQWARCGRTTAIGQCVGLFYA